MKTTLKRKWLSLLLCVVLIAAAALVTTGCSETKEEPQPSTEDTVVLGEGEVTAQVVILPAEDGAELGEGETEFPLTIVDLDGNESHVTIHTNQTIVGEALQELGLIEGEEGPYGLYVKTVNGITVDYDTDNAYWAFYINGRYAMSGVDVTEIDSGDTYELRAERG